jgi:hypothetical protein
MITYLTDDLCQVIHSPDPDRAETKQWRAGSLWSVFPDEARITISVQLLRDSAGRLADKVRPLGSYGRGGRGGFN